MDGLFTAFGRFEIVCILLQYVGSSTEYEYEKELQKCEINRCNEKANNNRCDEVCNTPACKFDNGDCSFGINPWRNCTAPIECWDVFMNGHCDQECNNVQCLFDGRDCEKLQPCQ